MTKHLASRVVALFSLTALVLCVAVGTAMADGLTINPAGPAIPVSQTMSGAKYIRVSGTYWDRPVGWVGGWAYITITNTSNSQQVGYEGDIVVGLDGKYEFNIGLAPGVDLPITVEILVQIYDSENQFHAGGTVVGLTTGP